MESPSPPFLTSNLRNRKRGKTPQEGTLPYPTRRVISFIRVGPSRPKFMSESQPTHWNQFIKYRDSESETKTLHPYQCPDSTVSTTLLTSLSQTFRESSSDDVSLTSHFRDGQGPKCVYVWGKDSDSDPHRDGGNRTPSTPTRLLSSPGELHL